MNRGKENVTNFACIKFSMSYKIRFSTNIRGHHVYKSAWKPEKGKELDWHKDNRDEASMYDNHATGVYKQEKIPH